MPAQPTAPATTIRDRFLADHRRLEELFASVLSAVDANDRERIEGSWAEFDTALSADLGAQEKLLVPALLQSRAREARAILQEHRHIRARLLELGAAIRTHVIRGGMARGFLDELRAHARHEDTILSEWDDDPIDGAR
jgi:hypothetical protein